MKDLLTLVQIAGSDSSWSCVGENVLDVLLEMEREREKKEKVVHEILRVTHWPISYFGNTTESQCCYFQLYWDLQLLNVAALNTLHEKSKPATSRSRALNRLHQSTKPNLWINAPNQSDSECVQPHTSDTDSLQVCACSACRFSVSLLIITFTNHTQKERLQGRKGLYESVKAVRRLKKAARHCWARWVA